MTEKIGTTTFDVLRQLANRWTLKAREFARDSKSDNPADPIAAYNRGLAEGYYKAAVELAETLRQQASPETLASSLSHPFIASAPETQRQPPAPKPLIPSAPAETYLSIPLNEVLMILEYAGTNARDVSVNKQNVFMAVFSKWENLMLHERIDKLKKADMRLVVLNSGKIKDTNDPYVEFAFKDIDGA
jgi:hypothetical protein